MYFYVHVSQEYVPVKVGFLPVRYVRQVAYLPGASISKTHSNAAKANIFFIFLNLS